jgi:hypothetical protein
MTQVIKGDIMKKKILLCIMLLFLTGCDAEYTLEINDDNYEELTSIVENDSSNLNKTFNNITYKKLFDMYLKKPIPISKYEILQDETDEEIPNVIYYDKKDLSTNLQTGMELSGTFSSKNIESSNMIEFAYGNLTVEKDDDVISISTENKAKIFEQFSTLDNLTVNIKTDYKVTENNADKVQNNVYTWNINRENYSNKPIIIEIKTSDDDISFQMELIIGGIILVLITIMTILFFRFKTNQSNKI